MRPQASHTVQPARPFGSSNMAEQAPQRPWMDLYNGHVMSGGSRASHRPEAQIRPAQPFGSFNMAEQMPQRPSLDPYTRHFLPGNLLASHSLGPQGGPSMEGQRRQSHSSPFLPLHRGEAAGIHETTRHPPQGPILREQGRPL